MKNHISKIQEIQKKPGVHTNILCSTKKFYTKKIDKKWRCFGYSEHLVPLKKMHFKTISKVKKLMYIQIFYVYTQSFAKKETTLFLFTGACSPSIENIFFKVFQNVTKI